MRVPRLLQRFLRKRVEAAIAAEEDTPELEAVAAR